MGKASTIFLFVLLIASCANSSNSAESKNTTSVEDTNDNLPKYSPDLYKAAQVTCSQENNNYILTQYSLPKNQEALKKIIKIDNDMTAVINDKYKIYVNGQKSSEFKVEHLCELYNDKIKVLTSVDLNKEFEYEQGKGSDDGSYKTSTMVSSPEIIRIYEGDKLLGTYLVPLGLYKEQYQVRVDFEKDNLQICTSKICSTYVLSKIRNKPFYYQQRNELIIDK